MLYIEQIVNTLTSRRQAASDRKSSKTQRFQFISDFLQHKLLVWLLVKSTVWLSNELRLCKFHRFESLLLLQKLVSVHHFAETFSCSAMALVEPKPCKRETIGKQTTNVFHIHWRMTLSDWHFEWGQVFTDCHCFKQGHSIVLFHQAVLHKKSETEEKQQGNVKRTLDILRDERQTGLLPTNLATSKSVFSSSIPSICALEWERGRMVQK